ncbi:hypothetical protein BMS3Abin15_00807 [bacterium BMS3Abin15]|nr:hypothetical protein BMS3Abin15_00807 [bacterium BMS3Abin15]HDZ85285.1 hypothetical protein [Candidatus Moranbacteria bacterium]
MEILYDVYSIVDNNENNLSAKNAKSIGKIKISGKVAKGENFTLSHNFTGRIDTMVFYSIVRVETESYPNKVFVKRIGSANLQ